MSAAVQISTSLYCCSSIRDATLLSSGKTATAARFPREYRTAFASGSPLLIQKPFHQRMAAPYSKPISIRCEQNTNEGSGLDIWLGRLAMVGFTAAITVEIVTGKGLLENFGLASPLPTVALAVTSLVGVLAAVFIFRSASNN